jgi:hypothetical protein
MGLSFDRSQSLAMSRDIYIYLFVWSCLFFNVSVLTFFSFYIQNVYVHARPVSPGFVQQIMPNAYILLKDVTIT